MTVGSRRAEIRDDPEASRRARRHDGAMRIAVHDGRVDCPRRGDIDVETCFACRSFQSLEGRAVLRCHEPVLLGPPARWSRRLVLPARKTG
jgi:hypothetical protein